MPNPDRSPANPPAAAALLAELLPLARTLLEASHDAPRMALRGRKLALWCADVAAGDSADAQRFRRAANALGAHVALVQPGLSDASTPEQMRVTAQLVGRLYDGVECQGLPPALRQRFGALTGVPVFDGTARAAAASLQWIDPLDGPAIAEHKRTALLQALLLQRMASAGRA